MSIHSRFLLESIDIITQKLFNYKFYIAYPLQNPIIQTVTKW